ncbi:MAG: GEVED domain-containing protein, partial [Pseudomonadota bacterium]
MPNSMERKFGSLIKQSLACATLVLAPVQAFAQAACSVGDMVEFASVYYEDFGTGARTDDPNVLNHQYRASGIIPDGWYAVDTSAGTGAGFSNTAGNVDADGNTSGRYLFLNMLGAGIPGGWTGEFYRQDNVSLLPPGLPSGATLGGFRFSNEMVGTCGGCRDIPNFTLIIEDNNDGSQLASITSTSAGILNDDVWRQVTLDVIPAPATATAANLVLFNSQPDGSGGNDVGVDNIDFRPLVCYAPVLDLDKTFEVITNNTGDPDKAEAGDIIRYTYTISNNGSATGYNVSLSEVGFTGTGTAPAPTVFSGAADLDGGDGTATDVAVGAQLVYRADYIITQADIDAGGVVENGASISYEDLVDSSFSTDFDDDPVASGNQPNIALIPVIANDDTSSGNTAGASMSQNIASNDGADSVASTVNLVPPAGATSILTDADGDVIGFTVPGEGTWSYADGSGQLTFSPVTGFNSAPTPVNYTIDGTNGLASNEATVSFGVNVQPVHTFACGPGTTRVDWPGSTISSAATTLASNLDTAGGDIVQFSLQNYDNSSSTAATLETSTGTVRFVDRSPFAGHSVRVATNREQVLRFGYDGSNTSGDGQEVSAFDALDQVTYTANSASPVTWSVIGSSNADYVISGNSITIVGSSGSVPTDTQPFSGYTIETTGDVTSVDVAHAHNEGTLGGINSMRFAMCSEPNDPPVAVDNTETGNTLGSPASVSITANDTDSDGTIDPTTVNLTTPTGATNVVTDADGDVVGFDVPGQGTWAYDDTTGELVFTAVSGFNGDPTPISYTVDDNDGTPSNEATVTVGFTPNTPPVTTGSCDRFTADLSNFPTTAFSSATAEIAPGLTMTVASSNIPLRYNTGNDWLEIAPGGSSSLTSTITYTFSRNVSAVQIDTSDYDVQSVGGTLNEWLSNISVPPSGTTGDLAIITTSRVEPQVPNSLGGVFWDGMTSTNSISFQHNRSSSGLGVRFTGIGVNIEGGAAACPMPPVAVADSSTGNSIGSDVVLDVTANDTDSDGTVDATTVSLVLPTGATDVVTDLSGDVIGFTVPGEGVWSVDETTGQVTFSPEPGFVADPTDVGYTVRDNENMTSAAGVISVDYNDPPGLARTLTCFGGASTAVWPDILALNTGVSPQNATGIMQTNTDGSTISVGITTDNDTYLTAQSDINGGFNWYRFGGSAANHSPEPHDGTYRADAIANRNDGVYTFTYSAPIINPGISVFSGGSSSIAVNWVFTDENGAAINSKIVPGSRGMTQVSSNEISMNEGHGSVQLEGTFSQINVTASGPEFWAAMSPFVSCLQDFSDAPLTGTNYGFASHINTPTLTLGPSATPEFEDFDSAAADGDVDNGITLPSEIEVLGGYTLPASDISAVGDGTLHAWIDFDGNGTFDADEYASIGVTSGTADGALSWSEPTDSVIGATTFARFRLTSDASVTAATPSSAANDGEVEDYQVFIAGTPELSVIKSISSVTDSNGNGLVGDYGDTVTYRFDVTNTGNTSLADVSITDSKLGLTNALVTPDDLGPGQVGSLTGQTYTISDVDADAGFTSNTATGSGTPVATLANGNADPSTPVLDSTGTALPAASDTSDTGTEPDLDGSNNPVDVTNPETTDTNGTAGDDDAEPTVLTIPRFPAPVSPTAVAAPAHCVAPTNWNEVIFAAGGAGVAGDATVATTGFTTIPFPASQVDASNRYAGSQFTTQASILNNVPFFVNRPPLDTGPTSPPGHTPMLDTFTQSFGGAENVYEVRHHWQSLDQIGWGFDPALNPGVGWEYLSGTDDVGNARTSANPLLVDALDIDQDGQGQVSANDTDGRLSADFTIRFYSTNGQPISQIVWTIEEDRASDGAPEGWGFAMELCSVPPSIAIEKSVAGYADTNANGFMDAGDTLSYSFRVENTSVVPLTDVVVTDALPGIVVSGGPLASLAPGAEDTSTFTASYVLQAADIAAGGVENTAVAGGTVLDSTGNPIANPNDPGNPSTVTGASDAGTDPDGNSLADPSVVETADLSGSVDGDPLNDPTVFQIEPSPGIEVIKNLASIVDNGDGVLGVGDVVNYSFAVTNTGNVDLGDVTVTDPTASVSGGPITLGIGVTDTTSFTAQLTLDATHVAAGGVENTASVGGTALDASGDPIIDPLTAQPVGVSDDSDSGTEQLLDSSGNPVAQSNPETVDGPNLAGTTDGDPTNDPTVLFIPAPSLTVVKSVATVLDDNIAGGDGLFGGDGDTINYTFTVTNTGNVDLAGITLSDGLPGIVVSGGPIDLDVGVGDSLSFTATYTVQPSDTARGYIENSATATGNAVDSADNPIYGPTGTPLTASATSDAGTDPDTDPVLDPLNTETPDGTGTTDSNPGNDPTVTSVPGNPTPRLSVIKSVASVADTSGDGVIGAGDTLTFSFAVTNTGNVDLADVTITDGNAVMSGGPISLAIGATDTSTFTATHVITAAEAASGSVENSAQGTGGAVNSVGDPLLDPDTGLQRMASDTSDAGTDPDIGPSGVPTAYTDPLGNETPDGSGNTDADPTNDPTVFNLPMPGMQVIKSVASVDD